MIGGSYDNAFMAYIDSLKEEDLHLVGLLAFIGSNLRSEEEMQMYFGKAKWRSLKKYKDQGYIEKKNRRISLTDSGKKLLSDFQMKYFDNRNYFFT